VLLINSQIAAQPSVRAVARMMTVTLSNVLLLSG
jgi:hypothetical protein